MTLTSRLDSAFDLPEPVRDVIGRYPTLILVVEPLIYFTDVLDALRAATNHAGVTCELVNLTQLACAAPTLAPNRASIQLALCSTVHPLDIPTHLLDVVPSAQHKTLIENMERGWLVLHCLRLSQRNYVFSLLSSDSAKGRFRQVARQLCRYLDEDDGYGSNALTSCDMQGRSLSQLELSRTPSNRSFDVLMVTLSSRAGSQTS